MSFQILLNFVIAVAWMFLQNDNSLAAFSVGYVLGLIIIFVFRRFFPRRFFLYNLFAAIKLVFIFLKELILSNIAVVKIVLSPKLQMKPGIFAFETDLEKNWEITILSNLITLTPGTFVMEISHDNKILYIHSINIDDMEQAKNDIRNSFEKAIKEVSR